jgi:hypothetical protein
MDAIINQITNNLKKLKKSCKCTPFKNGNAKFYMNDGNIYSNKNHTVLAGNIKNNILTFKKDIKESKSKHKHRRSRFVKSNSKSRSKYSSSSSSSSNSLNHSTKNILTPGSINNSMPVETVANTSVKNISTPVEPIEPVEIPESSDTEPTETTVEPSVKNNSTPVEHVEPEPESSETEHTEPPVEPSVNTTINKPLNSNSSKNKYKSEPDSDEE